MDYRRSPTQSPYGTPRDLGGPSNAAAAGSRSNNSRAAAGATAYQPAANPEASNFDIFEWYPKYMECVRHFVDVSQHTYPCQALAAFVNIRLPYQRAGDGSSQPVSASSPPSFRPAFASSSSSGAGLASPLGMNQPAMQQQQHQYGWVSLHPYLRRLVATGFDVPAILHGWFGDEWLGGIGPLHEQERRNYLFAAKAGGWAAVKRDYDVVTDEGVPYLKPLDRVDDAEIESAEGSWSKWLAMEDWMLGSRAPIIPDGVNDAME
ncbi:hypothetical protein FN846DRAFT_517089 [Sphaerosporella brunnea]|uniref:Ilp is an apoptosis inhibitor n=1 Tax=Sphaerosporella brunnea TaxID=1250544 RepID=A0A5J5F3U4_9PEZI|nr:hypothetical protein FN846DRAFT_517089 [Sphaerosporella brunnea]